MCHQLVPPTCATNVCHQLVPPTCATKHALQTVLLRKSQHVSNMRQHLCHHLRRHLCHQTSATRQASLTPAPPPSNCSFPAHIGKHHAAGKKKNVELLERGAVHGLGSPPVTHFLVEMRGPVYARRSGRNGPILQQGTCMFGQPLQIAKW